VRVCVRACVRAWQPYTTFDTFYPFYLTEHSDMICRRLHVIGSSIVLLIAAAHPSVAFAAILAGAGGFRCLPLVVMPHINLDRIPWCTCRVSHPLSVAPFLLAHCVLRAVQASLV
jgi:hypothetical protein